MGTLTWEREGQQVEKEPVAKLILGDRNQNSGYPFGEGIDWKRAGGRLLGC